MQQEQKGKISKENMSGRNNERDMDKGKVRRVTKMQRGQKGGEGGQREKKKRDEFRVGRGQKINKGYYKTTTHYQSLD